MVVYNNGYKTRGISEWKIIFIIAGIIIIIFFPMAYCVMDLFLRII